MAWTHSELIFSLERYIAPSTILFTHEQASRKRVEYAVKLRVERRGHFIGPAPFFVSKNHSLGEWFQSGNLSIRCLWLPFAEALEHGRRLGAGGQSLGIEPPVAVTDDDTISTAQRTASSA